MAFGLYHWEEKSCCGRATWNDPACGERPTHVRRHIRWYDRLLFGEEYKCERCVKSQRQSVNAHNARIAHEYEPMTEEEAEEKIIEWDVDICSLALLVGMVLFALIYSLVKGC